MVLMNRDKMNNDQLMQIFQNLKREKNCFVIAHNYQDMRIQLIADFVGDSLQMAKVASQTDADMILVCGIKIMADTAKILNPSKKILMAHPSADCQLANMQSPSELLKLTSEYPDAEVICYVNSPAELKAESTITCTSANAVELVKRLPAHKPIIFVPDRNIGSWVQYKTGRKLIMFDSFCYVHHQITLNEVKKLKAAYPQHKLLVHPECRLEVCLEADLVCSTSQMIEFTKNNDKVIIGTEYGLYEQLKYYYPEKDLVALSPRMICEDLKKTTLKGALEVLKKESNEVVVTQRILEKSQKSLSRMFELMK